MNAIPRPPITAHAIPRWLPACRSVALLSMMTARRSPTSLRACHCTAIARSCPVPREPADDLRGSVRLSSTSEGDVERYRKRADGGREAVCVRCAELRRRRVWHEATRQPRWVFGRCWLRLVDPSLAAPGRAHLAGRQRARPSALIPDGALVWRQGTGRSRRVDRRFQQGLRRVTP